MGHTQWMPEVWLNLGIDYDGDGRVNPFGKPDDALGTSAKFLVQRGKYRRGEDWGYEVRAGGKSSGEASRSYDDWAKAGVTRADGAGVPQPEPHRQALGAGRGRARVPARSELQRDQELQPVDRLYALDRASWRPRARRRAVRAEIPRQRTPADARRGAGGAEAPHRGGLRHRRQRRPHRQHDDGGGRELPAQGRDIAGGRLCGAEGAGEAAGG